MANYHEDESWRLDSKEDHVGHSHSFQEKKQRKRHLDDCPNWDYKRQRRNKIDKSSKHEHRQKSRAEKKLHVGFKKLEEWNKEDSDVIITELLSRKMGFEDLLESNLSQDAIVLMVKILAKMCLSPFNANKSEIMYLVSQEKFTSQLTTYIMQLALQDDQERLRNAYFWENTDGFFNDLAVVCESFIDTMPIRAGEVLSKILKAVNLSIPNLQNEQEKSINREIKDKFEKLQVKLDLHKIEIGQKKKEPGSNKSHEQDPPNDFRQLSVYPTSEEILINRRPFVRENVIKGAYSDVNHYLDVQFRLLKEDFVAPLREAINAYMRHAPSEKKKISNVKIHPHVEFVSPRYNRNQVGVLLQFEFQKKRRINFNYSKRFMFGSLLCFTQDNFQTLLFGKVLERDRALLEQRQIVVGFEAEYNNYELKRPYVMVECSVYFEPYYHVLRALQNMKEERFPMKNYIIDVNPILQPPNYLKKESVYKINKHKVFFDTETWPSNEELGLDVTQYNAFKAALTEKFVIIQGPPGTGKTYLGLQIAKTLIENRQFWRPNDNPTPILVVCYTNHALDQFLEGLVDITNEIVRVGGQSKNENLEQLKLRRKRYSARVCAHANYAINNVKKQFAYFLKQVQNISEILEDLYKFHNVIKFKNFSSVDKDFNESWFAKASNKETMEWLFGGRTQRGRQVEIHWGRQKEIEMEERHNHQDINDEFYELQYEQFHAEHDLEDDVDISEVFGLENTKQYPLASISELEDLIKNCLEEIHALKAEVHRRAVFNKQWELERQLGELQDNLDYLKFRLKEGKNAKIILKPEYVNLKKPQYMNADDRWKLYFYWLDLYRDSLIQKLNNMQALHQEKYKQYIELKDMDDLRIMRQMLVVGMTTTGAARLQTILQALKCRILIVEEAAEVLESHTIVSLTSHCEHLILIGDHQQLRPSTANYQMETKFNLGISLFERMVQNNVQCHVLGVQHRMRPEIAKLIVPAIYPSLENHHSVLHFSQVWGIDSCVYFINHNHPEGDAGDCTKLNMHEAEFIISLACYLIQNGYKPEDITILAAYSGQMFALWRERKKYQTLLKDVRITVLDNYQGEESKIILLSLVRNNEENSIGFLKIENRVCVALSRAKEGFYMMGNMDLLCRNSQIWPKVKEALESQGYLGETLTLRCQVHPEQIVEVRSAADFRNVPEGGCKIICNVEMDCGHICTRICHIIDRNHQTVKCSSHCSRACRNNHPCSKLCYKDCGLCQIVMKKVLPCGHEHDIPCSMDPNEYRCPTPVQTELSCGHTVTDKPCHEQTETFKCPFPCDTRVEPCGHQCNRMCHVRDDPDHLKYKCQKPCARPRKGCSTGEHMCHNKCSEDCSPCTVTIKKMRKTCTHPIEIACSINVEDVKCCEPCTMDLACAHKCPNKCHEPCGNCKVKVDKKLPECNHVVKTKCCKEPSRKDCRGKCPLKLSCGHVCQAKCSEGCTTRCRKLVDHNKAADCGHKFKIECGMLSTEYSSNSYELLKFCREPCTAQLECEHTCSGTCGKCAQGRVHVSCKNKCGVPLICGHECPIPCSEACQPCTKNCSYRCKHSRCRKACGDPCTKCKERCERRCVHVRCFARCGDKCTVPPCTEPCNRRLRCGHRCVGYCGGPCPPLCRVCDKAELTEVFLGFENEKYARFVWLDECKHVIESQGMDMWLQQDGNEINYKCCPKCKTPLTSTTRYSDYIKEAMEDVLAVKKKFFGSFKENEKNRINLLEKLKKLEEDAYQLILYAPFVDKFLTNLKQLLAPVHRNRWQALHMLLAATCTSKMQIAENIIDSFKDANLTNRDVIKKAANYVNFLFEFLMRQEQIRTNKTTLEVPRITNQEISDFQRELERFSRIAQLCQIENGDKFSAVIAREPEAKAAYEQIDKQLFSVFVYTDQMHADLKEQLIKLSKEIEASVVFTDKERQEIVRAMGMKRGQWFKCPNGHYYAIGDCGGAVVVGKCNECGERIGGTNHQLLNSNRHAGEMDSSRFAAYSETANNLFNFAEFY